MNDTKNNLQQNSIRIKPAAIWARVSTPDQREPSLPSQIDRCRAKLEQEGYAVVNTLFTDWSSLDLFDCPQFQELRRLIKDEKIQALCVFDRDRLEAKGLQRLVFLSECKEAGVKMIICQGPPILDEPEGQLVELAMAIGKERQVLRARQGSKDGLHDRALKRRLPTSRHRLYGYKWEGDRQLVPDDNWSTLKLIFDMLLADSTYQPIINELKKRVILSPQGQMEWNKAAISNIAHNPVYAGRYYALKKQAVKPVKRRGNTYGNSSQRKLSLDEAHYIPDIKIVNPPITWEQRLQILEQLAKHQKLAQRNAKRDYLLRGMIFCETHRGKKEGARVFHGRPRGNSWCYVCPVGGCETPYINGQFAESFVKGYVTAVLFLSPDEFYMSISDTGNRDELTKNSNRELQKLQKEFDQLVNNQARIEDDHYNQKVDNDIYQRLKVKYQARRQWIRNRQDEILNKLAQLGHEKEVVDSWWELKNKVFDRLSKPTTLANSEWRVLLTKMNFKWLIEQEDTPMMIKTTSDENLTKDERSILRKSTIELGLPIKDPSIVRDIVLSRPEPG